MHAVSSTSAGMSGKVFSLGSSDFSSVLGNSGDGGVSLEMSSAGSLDFGGIYWDSVVTQNNWSVGPGVPGIRVSPWGVGSIGGSPVLATAGNDAQNGKDE